MNASIHNTQSQIEGLATLLVLDDETRKLKSLREFGFFTTNETHRLLPYHTAYLWQKNDFTGNTLVAQSGTAEIDRSASINLWLKEKIAEFIQLPKNHSILQINLSIINPNSETNNSSVNQVWQDALPPHVLWCPMLDNSDELAGGLIFFRETEFSESEIKMLRWLLATYQYTWLVLTSKKIPLWKRLREKKITLFLITILVIILALPIHLSVLATANVVPKNPVLINAPMQGIIKSFAVSPGDTVHAGQLLLTLDKTDLESDEKVSNRELQLTQSKLRTAINQSFNNQDIPSKDQNNAEVPVLQAQLQIDKARLEYTKKLLAKTDINSPIDGIVIFDSKEDWVGQSVQTGERILTIANPSKVKLQILIPVTNAIRLNVGAAGDFFLYGQLQSIPIKVITLGYNARLTPSKILAYQIEAEFVRPTDHPQLGAEGTARIYGNRVPLIYYLLRKPLQLLRQTTGF